MKRCLPAALSVVMLLSLFAGCSKSDPATTSTGNLPSAQSDSGNNPTTTAGSSSGNGNSSGNDTPFGNSPLGQDLQRCMTMLTGYAGLFPTYMTSSGSADDRAKLKASLEDMKKQVPDNIKKDLDFIENGFANANSLSELSTFLDSSDYKKADKEVTDYLDTQCGGNTK